MTHTFIFDGFVPHLKCLKYLCFRNFCKMPQYDSLLAAFLKKPNLRQQLPNNIFDRLTSIWHFISPKRAMQPIYLSILFLKQNINIMYTILLGVSCIYIYIYIHSLYIYASLRCRAQQLYWGSQSRDVLKYIWRAFTFFPDTMQCLKGAFLLITATGWLTNIYM